jgi:hypothetical protein
MKRLLVLVLLAACTTQPAAPPVASTPPPPDRPENAAVAYGVVTDAGGRPVRRAAVRAWAADPGCNARGIPASHVTGEQGTFELRVVESVGPEYDGCVVVEASAGGATARVQQPARYASDRSGRNRVQVNIALPPAPLLTRAEADRLMELVQRALRREHEAVQELATYLGEDVATTYSTLTAPMSTLRNVQSVTLVSSGPSEYLFEMTGQRPGSTARVRIAQDSLTRIEFP